MTLQVSNIAGDRETWRRYAVKLQDTQSPPGRQRETRYGTDCIQGWRTPTGVRHNANARARIWRRQQQVQQSTGLQAWTTTTTNAAYITDTGGRAGAHNIQVWHDRQRQHQEHEENQEEDAGGQGVAGGEDTKKAGATSGLSKEQHRQSPRTKAAMTQRDGEPPKVDYTRVGFGTLHFL